MTYKVPPTGQVLRSSRGPKVPGCDEGRADGVPDGLVIRVGPLLRRCAYFA